VCCDFFLGCANYSFIDDELESSDRDGPILKYTRTMDDIINKEFAEQLKNQFELAIDDNIKILKKGSGIIQIKPLYR
jgi:hypothetical protein